MNLILREGSVQLELIKMIEEYIVEIINHREDAYQLIWNYNKEIGSPLSDEELRQGIKKFLDKGNVIAVIREGKIISFMVLYCYLFETLDAYVCNLYVLKQYRRNHLAENMMKKAFDICMQNKFKSIHLHVSERNIPAVNLYKKLGFSFTNGYREGEREMVVKLNDR